MPSLLTWGKAVCMANVTRTDPESLARGMTDYSWSCSADIVFVLDNELISILSLSLCIPYNVSYIYSMVFLGLQTTWVTQQ
jgi:hypothetical protein